MRGCMTGHPARAKMAQNVLYGNVTKCHFFIPWLYAIKVVVVSHVLLAYNIAFFKVVFNIFPRSRFLKKIPSNVTRGSSIRDYCLCSPNFS